MEINYIVSVAILNTINGNTTNLSKDFVINISKPNNELYENVHEVWHGYILDLLKDEITAYLNTETITDIDIEISSYEIFSSTVGVDIFFENLEDPNLYTLTPAIKIYINPIIITPTAPTLIGTLISTNSIVWSWDEDATVGHYLLDENNEVLVQLPIGINSYTEANLISNTIYIRGLVSYNSDASSNISNQFTIKTGTSIDTLKSLHQYECIPNENYSIEDIKLETIAESLNLKAFHSGIGDGNDCLITIKNEKREDNSHWCPSIHNGYYYINQHEYFIFSGDVVENEEVTITGNTIETFSLPQQFCQPIVQDSILGSLQYVCFLDKEGIATLYDEESFTSTKQKIFELNNVNIDEPTLEIKINNAIVNKNLYTLKGNFLIFNDTVESNTIINLKYMIKNSFMITYDELNSKAIIKVNVSSPLTDVRIGYENNVSNNKKLLVQLSLNPIYNVNNKGFIYISYEDYEPVMIKAYTNPTTLWANGKDCTTIYVKLVDKYNNPVVGEKIVIGNIPIITTDPPTELPLGTVEISNEYTDINGIRAIRYISTTTPCIDDIIISHSRTLKTTLKMINKAVV